MIPIDLAREKLSEIEATASVTYGTNELEPLLREFLTILEQYPEARRDFESLLTDLLRRGPDATAMTLEFTMHRLRWHAIKAELISLRQNTNNSNIQRSVDRILTSFDDDWPEADVYDFYSNETPMSNR